LGGGLADEKIMAGRLRAGDEKGGREKPSASFPYIFICIFNCHTGFNISSRWPDILPKDTLPKDILPKEILLNRYFANGLFAERTFCRTDILPNGQFGERTV
jgi:hypothetical protein